MSHLTGQLAELGVMLMMFGVGLHFSLEDLMAVRRIAIPGAIVQIVGAMVSGAAVAVWWGWSLGATTRGHCYGPPGGWGPNRRSIAS